MNASIDRTGIEEVLEATEIHLKALNAALEAGIGAQDVLRAQREALALRVGSSDPALLARFEF